MPAPVAPPPARTTGYGPDPAQVYDVRLPTDPRGVTVVVVHGGFWRAGFDRSHAGAQAQALCENGFHVAVIEYRRTGMPGGGWPGTADDVRSAIAAVRTDPALPGVVLLLGHSAGGHLVAWAASQPWSEGVAGAVSLGGCVDLSRSATLGLGDGAVLAFMGGTPQQRAAAYAAADPARLTPRVPVHLVHGRRDSTVPIEISQSYQRIQHERTGAAPPLTVLQDCGHFEPIEPGTDAFAAVLAVLAGVASEGSRPPG